MKPNSFTCRWRSDDYKKLLVVVKAAPFRAEESPLIGALVAHVSSVRNDLRHSHAKCLEHLEDGGKLRVAASSDRSVKVRSGQASVLRQITHAPSRLDQSTDSR